MKFFWGGWVFTKKLIYIKNLFIFVFVTFLRVGQTFQERAGQTPSIMAFIKQFVVTICSKERAGLIVPKTLKNGIFIVIVTSKGSHFNADFKHTSFIKFRLTHQKL